MIGYKLMRKRKDSTYGALFIDRRRRLNIGKVAYYRVVPTKGFAFRPGWHIMCTPEAPHLSKKDRVWCRVSFEPMGQFERPQNQGGLWYLGRWITGL
tara:strand:- start:1499 stop:1789 length:291 start_codon:yes stop_codon:yes gene_type:complete